MACTAPLHAWRTPQGGIVLRVPPRHQDGTEYLRIPCGTCVGCRLAQGRSWAIRCQLELQAHEAACWVTLTYDEAHVPPTLHKGHLQLWLKRLRAHFGDRRVRFFACGEYGETFGRPHYHVILFGCSQRDAFAIAETWGKGSARVDRLEPAAIAYVCGYQLKKAGIRDRIIWGDRVPDNFTGPSAEVLDKSTGELYRRAVDYQPPFLQMSRNPGIGAHARQHWTSWRDSAIWGDRKFAVPRYLHAAWKGKATPEQILTLRAESLARMPHDLASLQEYSRHQAAQAAINEASRKASLSNRTL